MRWRRILYVHIHQGHPHIIWELMEYSLHPFFCGRYQIHATSERSLLPDWRLQCRSVLFYHNIGAGLSLRQKIFNWYNWLSFWTNQPHGQHWMYCPNTICLQHLTDAAPRICFILDLGKQHLIYCNRNLPNHGSVSFFVSPYREKISLISLGNGKNLLWHSP